MNVVTLDVVPSHEDPPRFQWVDWYNLAACRYMSIVRLHIQSTDKRNEYACHVKSVTRTHRDNAVKINHALKLQIRFPFSAVIRVLTIDVVVGRIVRGCFIVVVDLSKP